MGTAYQCDACGRLFADKSKETGTDVNGRLVHELLFVNPFRKCEHIDLCAECAAPLRLALKNWWRQSQEARRGLVEEWSGETSEECRDVRQREQKHQHGVD